ncbi:MAG: Flp pilus assembly protein CpaB [Gordonibacter sp.]|nr:Flp pilus assembly protein CpaB [Gordonibacter sp.]
MRQRKKSGPSLGYASREASDQSTSSRSVVDGEHAGSRSVRSDASSMSSIQGEKSDSRRIKRLAAVSAVSVAVALVSVAYGTWSVLSAQSAVDAVGADAQPTLIAKGDIQAGSELERSALEVRMVPRGLRVASALSGETLSEGRSIVGKRVLVSLSAGSQITPELVAGVEGGDRLASSLEAGMQAVTVGVDAESGLAGQLYPSDRVRVVALEGVMSGETHLATICDNVRVLSLDGSRSRGDAGYTSVTLEVTPSQADAVRAAQYAGKVSFVLVSGLDDLSLPGGVNPAVGEEATNG